jgi:hypothetical protein
MLYGFLGYWGFGSWADALCLCLMTW